MVDVEVIATVVVSAVFAGWDRIARWDVIGRTRVERRDRGAVSLEQVLWFVAAGVSVAVIAAILWSQIRAEATTPIDAPSAP